MVWGNCLLGAIALRLHTPGRIVIGGWYSCLPHFIFVHESGYAMHYVPTDLMYCKLFYRGKFVEYR